MRASGLFRLGACLAVVAVTAVACGSSSSNSSSTSTSAPTTTARTGGSTSSGPGVTSSTITVSNVSILSGPVPGLFQGAPNGVKAFFNYINSTQGGVNGRKLVLKSEDDTFSCTQNQALTQSDASQVLAFVGSFSLYDNCGAKVFTQNTNLADVSYTLDPTAQALTNNFSPQPQTNGFRTGPFAYYKANYPKAIKAVGALVSNVSSAVANWNGQRATMESMGYKVAYLREINPLETDFTADIEKMRNNGVQLLYLTDLDIKRIALILNAAQQQGWHPQLITAGGTAYDGSFFKLTNPGAGQGLLNDQQQAMYLSTPKSDASTVPEVKLFDTWMSKTNPGFPPDIFSVFGWASGRLFYQALQAAGPNPTQSSLLTALRNIHTFNSNGLLAPADPASKTPATCWVLIKINGTQYQRVSPSAGFRCDGGYHRAG